jgi:hypothetical protein
VRGVKAVAVPSYGLFPQGVRARFVQRAATAVFLVGAVVRLIVWLGLQAPVDWEIYRDAALRWQAGDSYFLPHQLAGPHVLGHGEVLYPPTTLWLLVPFTHLPEFLWWGVPIAMLVGVIVWMRPGGWSVPVIAFLLMTPHVQGVYLTGRPTMWIVAFFALALIRGGWGALVLLKPSLFPFALAGVRRRWWWVTVALLLAASVALPLSLWLDWVTAMRNSNGGLLYSILDIVILGIPLAAYVGRRRPPAEDLPSP